MGVVRFIGLWDMGLGVLRSTRESGTVRVPTWAMGLKAGEFVTEGGLFLIGREDFVEFPGAEGIFNDPTTAFLAGLLEIARKSLIL